MDKSIGSSGSTTGFTDEQEAGAAEDSPEFVTDFSVSMKWEGSTRGVSGGSDGVAELCERNGEGPLKRWGSVEGPAVVVAALLALRSATGPSGMPVKRKDGAAVDDSDDDEAEDSEVAVEEAAALSKAGEGAGEAGGAEDEDEEDAEP